MAKQANEQKPDYSSTLTKLLEFIAGSILGAVLGVYFERLSNFWLVVLSIGAAAAFSALVILPQLRKAIILALIGLVSGLIVAVILYRPWCNEQVFQLEVSYDTHRERFVSAGSVTVEPNTTVVIRAVSFEETPEARDSLTCKWKHEGDVEITQESGCILKLKSGRDENLDIVSVTVNQRLCGGVSKNLFIHSQSR